MTRSTPPPATQAAVYRRTASMLSIVAVAMVALAVVLYVVTKVPLVAVAVGIVAIGDLVISLWLRRMATRLDVQSNPSAIQEL